MSVALGSISVIAWMDETSAVIAAEADRLTQLDSAIGDGDHGVNLARGFRPVCEALAGSGADGLPPGRQLIVAGKTLVSTVGGASGPLWGTALRRAGRAVGEAAELDLTGLAGALDAALAGVVELGAAESGDKTMVDALRPAALALRAAVEADAPFAEALEGGRERGRGRRPGDRADAGSQGPRVVLGRALHRPRGSGRGLDRADRGRAGSCAGGVMAERRFPSFPLRGNAPCGRARRAVFAAARVEGDRLALACERGLAPS